MAPLNINVLSYMYMYYWYISLFNLGSEMNLRQTVELSNIEIHPSDT